MTERRLTVHLPDGPRTIRLSREDAHRDLAEVLRRAGLPLNTRCGREGLCNGCLVEWLQGEQHWLAAPAKGENRPAGEPVRACQLCAGDQGDMAIRVPSRSLLAHDPQIVASFRCNVSYAWEPLWQRLPAEFADVASLTSLIERITQHCSKELPVRPEGSLGTLAPEDGTAPRPAEDSLSRLTGNASGCGDRVSGRSGKPDTQLLALDYRGDHWLLHRAGREAATRPLGLAVDVGTTTVVLLLVDLGSGDVLATASALNAQVYLGDNVVTRINLCVENKRHVRELQLAVAEKTLAPLIAQVLAEAGAKLESLAAVAVAGNTTMLHLLAGVDPSSLGTAPFAAQFLDYRRLALRELPRSVSSDTPRGDGGPSHWTTAGAALQTETSLHLLPGAAAYVGADITAGVFSSGMLYRREPCLLVDIGTNGEIVLQFEQRLIGCATAAGPAFEGAGMSCGVRAGKGAISHVKLLGDPIVPELEVIGSQTPIGLCGTGYVDFVSQARLRGLIGATGRLTPAGLQCGLVRPLARGRGLQVARGRGGESIVVSEADIASLLQAKAAIAAGILCLLARFQLASSDVNTVYLAGGFGFHMDLDSLIGCGILPGFVPGQIEVVGNTSLAGAYLALLDAGALEEIKQIGRRMEVVELNLEPNFTSCYIDQLYLP